MVGLTSSTNLSSAYLASIGVMAGLTSPGHSLRYFLGIQGRYGCPQHPWYVLHICADNPLEIWLSSIYLVNPYVISLALIGDMAGLSSTVKSIRYLLSFHNSSGTYLTFIEDMSGLITMSSPSGTFSAAICKMAGFSSLLQSLRYLLGIHMLCLASPVLATPLATYLTPLGNKYGLISPD